MTDYRNLHDLARRQHRIISYRQARAEGVSDHRLRRWLDDGVIDRPYPGVYAFPGATDVPLGKLQAAALAVGDPVLAYGRTALWLHGVLPDAPPTFELVVPHRRRAPRLEAIVVHRSRTLLTCDATRPRGVPAASVPRALADLALSCSVRELHAVTIDAVQRRRTTLEAVAARARQRLAVRSRHDLAHVVARIEPHRPDSILEAEVRERLATLGYAAHVGPAIVDVGGRTTSIDIAFPAVRLGIECHGFGFHADRATFDRDHRKANLLRGAGWLLLAVTWQRVMQDWAGFLEEFLAAAAEVGLDPTN